MNQKTQALLLGILTIICWGSLATLGQLLSHLPPFYILAVTFFIAAIPTLFRPKEMFPSFKIFLTGVLGFFGYHFFLFYSFRFAPVIEANLINYMWPVILVLLTPIFFKHEKLRWYNFVGCIFSVLGCFLLVFNDSFELKVGNIYGHLLAFGAAITWPLFTITKKKLPTTSPWAVGGFFFGSSILALVSHYFLEPRVVLQAHDFFKLLLLGIGPFAMAYYSWDLAIQKGGTKLLGSLAYLTPVLSFLGLVLFADQALTFTQAIAMALIIGGASSGLMDFIPSKVLKKSK